MIYVTIRKHPFKGFYVVSTKYKCSDYCGWDIILVIEVLLWYLGVNPKYAFFSVPIKRLFKKWTT